jgi:hypothetical protein
MESIFVASSVGLTLTLCIMVLFKPRFVLSDAALLTGLLGLAGAELLQWRALAPGVDMLSMLRWSLAAQGLAVWAWIGFSMMFARADLKSHSPVLTVLLVAGVILPLLPLTLPLESMFGPVSHNVPWLVPLTSTGFYHHIGLLIGILICLYNLEATMANATHARRWRIKFFVLGIMAMLASQFLAASEGLLYRVADLSLNPTRQIGLILGVVLMGYSLVTRGGEENIVFSRRLAYKSLVLLAAGLYLVGIGLAGHLMRFFSGINSATVVMTLSVSGGIGLLAVVMSETVRRKTNMALRKYFYKDKYDYRVQWLEFNRHLASVGQNADLHQTLLLVFCENFGMGQGALYLRGQGSNYFEPACVWEMDQANTPLPVDHPLCQAPPHGLPVKDLRKQQPIHPAPKASFLIPLGLNQDIGGFILLDRPFNLEEEYDDEDFELMEAMAHQASLAIMNERLMNQLACAREMEIMGKVSSFVLHDLKNLVHTLSLILKNAEDYIQDPEFQHDLLTSLGNTVTKMNLLITQLRALPTQDTLRREEVDLLSLAQESAKAMSEGAVKVKGDPVQAAVDREEMNKVMVNLFRNAREACKGSDPVLVEVGRDTQPYVKISDHGCGMNEEFIRKKLFVPFSTTKDTGMGIGLYQCKQIVEAHGGRLEVASQPGRGSTFTVLLPNSQTS